MSNPKYSVKVLITLFTFWQLSNVFSDSLLTFIVVNVLFLYPIFYSKLRLKIDEKWSRAEAWINGFLDKLTFL